MQARRNPTRIPAATNSHAGVRGHVTGTVTVLPAVEAGVPWLFKNGKIFGKYIFDLFMDETAARQHALSAMSGYASQADLAHEQPTAKSSETFIWSPCEDCGSWKVVFAAWKRLDVSRRVKLCLRTLHSSTAACFWGCSVPSTGT